MKTVNKVILVGNITKDPYVKTTMGGKKVAVFTVATNRYFKDGAGNPMSESEYTNCSAWGNLAERCEQYMFRGKLVYVEGHLKTRVIDKDDGTRLFKTEVVTTNLIFLDRRGGSDESAEQSSASGYSGGYEDALFADDSAASFSEEDTKFDDKF